MWGIYKSALGVGQAKLEEWLSHIPQPFLFPFTDAGPELEREEGGSEPVGLQNSRARLPHLNNKRIWEPFLHATGRGSHIASTQQPRKSAL